tara:strand:- start:369 stop:857 length:489 start_codon:yes stop_codon:yes gene_type:complete
MSTLKVDTIQGKTTSGTVAMPSGHIIQAVVAEHSDINTRLITTSSSYSTTGTSLTITPKFSSSKILITYHGSVHNNTSGGYTQTIIYRDSTQLNQTDSACGIGSTWQMHGMHAVDAPNTTSATTYTIYALANSGGSAYVGWASSFSTPNQNMQYFSLMEIKQ